MAGWEEELAVLLRELGVTQEEPKTHLRPTQIGETSFPQGMPPVCHKDEIKRQVQAVDVRFWGRANGSNVRSSAGDAGKTEYDDADMSDLRDMHHEVDAIVKQIVYLMQHGDIDTSIKEDVLVVLRALRRRASVTQQAAASDTAYLEAVSAMLHFCRIVLRLNEAATEDF